MASNLSSGTPYLVPTQPTAQEFDISLAGVTYHLKLRWCAPNSSWILDIEDANRNLIVGGVPLVTGADLLEQFYYLGIGGALVVQSTDDPDLVPSYSTLGSTGNLFFIPSPSS